MHVRHGERVAKFWLVPQVGLAGAWAMSPTELNRLEKIVQEKRQEFESPWHDYFG